MSSRKRIAVGAALVVVLLAAGLYLLLPGIVARKIVAAAKDKGFDVTVGSVEVSLHSVIVHDLTVAASALPQLRATAKTATITLESFQPTDISIEGAGVDLDGDPKALTDHAAVLEADATPGDSIARVTLTGTFDWKTPFGQGSGARCDAFSLVFTRESMKGTCDGLRLTVGALVFGPWKLDLAHDGSGDSFLLDPEPAQRGQASCSWSRSAAGLTHLAVSIPSTTSGGLGIPEQALPLVGLARAPTLALTLKYDESSALAASGSFDVSQDLVPVGNGHVLPVQLHASFDGDPKGKLHVVSQAATLGGFGGSLTGDAEPTSLRGHFVFDATVMQCRDAANLLVTQAFGGLVGGLASTLGGGNVGGTVKLTATVDVDLHDLGKTRLSTATTGDCQLSLFP